MCVTVEYYRLILGMYSSVSSDEVLEWKLRVHHPLTTWVKDSTVLIGDASHPTLPHLAQGAAQACEVRFH
jgi:salicylate hydroxylase